MKRLLLALALLLPSAQSAPVPVTATEAVMQTSGYLDAQPEIVTLTLAVDHIAFRTMAYANQMTADLCIAQSVREPANAASWRAVALYFTGRSQAFDTAADLAGEPRP